MAYEPAEIANSTELARDGRWEVASYQTPRERRGRAVQFQTQWWLEQHGYYLPAVITVPGSRGDPPTPCGSTSPSTIRKL